MATLCVYCASSTAAPVRYVELAATLGTELAARGHDLVTGGGSISAMGAVATAARAGGAHTIGVIPQVLSAAEVADQEAGELVVTVDMRSRKAAMEARADAFLALPGGLGTMEELFEMWVARSLGLHHKPVVVVDPDGVYAGLRAQVDHLLAIGLVRPAAAAQVTWTSSPAEALDAIERQLAVGRPDPTPTASEAIEAEPG